MSGVWAIDLSTASIIQRGAIALLYLLLLTTAEGGYDGMYDGTSTSTGMYTTRYMMICMYVIITVYCVKLNYIHK